MGMMKMTMVNLPVACSFQRKSRRYVDSVWNHDWNEYADDDQDDNDDHVNGDDQDDDHDDDDHDDDDHDEGYLVAVNHEGEGERYHNSNHLSNTINDSLMFIKIGIIVCIRI